MRLTCPTCRKLLPVSSQATPDDASPFRPFCSSRCKMADLGSWLNESYKITSSVSDEDLDQGLATEGESMDPESMDRRNPN